MQDCMKAGKAEEALGWKGLLIGCAIRARLHQLDRWYAVGIISAGMSFPCHIPETVPAAFS